MKSKLFNGFCIIVIVILFYINFVSDDLVFSQALKPLPNNLMDSEKQTIQIFEASSPSVVFITQSRRHIYSNPNADHIPQGTGSGFMWDDKGHIVTNYHVISGADSLEVSLSDYSRYPAAVIGSDESKDIAVIKIKAPASKIKALKIGQSSNLRVGQSVMAIGNPFGLDNTLTTGVVSALGREITAINQRKIQNVIQTDAAINPGNSGGPLLNSTGELIGVNTAIISRSGSSSGIGFAVPIDTVKRVVPQLIKHGKVMRPGLGVLLLSDAVSRANNIKGLVINDVLQNSPAQKAGLRGTLIQNGQLARLGDILLAVDKRPLYNFDQLASLLEEYQIGDSIELKYSRDGKEYITKLKLFDLN